ncbi:MAG: thiamine phosphate synthase [Bacteroidota bacterium]|jgi:thiamine-phosphate pyrophosphorylase
MKLVVITPSKIQDNEISTVINMFEAGLETLHIRKNGFSTKELEDYIKHIPVHFHNRLVIHSHHKLALKYNLKGFHFTETHLKRGFKLWWNTKWIYIRKPNLVRTISFKRLSQLYELEVVNTDYCFLGKMFHNVSGQLYSGFYKETIEAANAKSGKKIIARGGISLKNIEMAYQFGFFGIALYGYLWKSSNPFNKYIEFINFCKEKNIPLE